MLSHAEHLAIPRETLLQKTLFACDELSGFVHACGLVRPTGLEGLEPKSVRKKLKQPSFAAGVHRDEVYAGAELLGLELDEHIANVVAALQPIAGELGLPVRLTGPSVRAARARLTDAGRPARVRRWPATGAAARSLRHPDVRRDVEVRRVGERARRRTTPSRRPGASQNTTVPHGGSGRGSRRARRRPRAPT